ncbi:hypothetical protein N9M66_05005 [Litoreibacter sp.]|nr:hypothetical protein [Litoreibacter sp.]
MGQIWLHIGSPKTGTTSLQGFLNDNQDTLRESGTVNFMAAGRSHIAHNQLAAAARMGEAERLFDAFQREADTMPDAKHVVTSELLFNPHTTRKLTQVVPESMKERTKVICYIRRQDSYLEALYKQFLKNSRIEPDRQAFLAEAPRLVRYFDVINAYGRAFGSENVIVRPFGSDTLTGGDVVLDFADQLGVEIIPGMKLQKDFANKTFSAEMSETLATMGEMTDFNVREVIRELIAIDHPNTIKSRDVFTTTERRALMESMAGDNRKLVRRYMPKHAGFFEHEDLDADAETQRDEAADQLLDRAAATEAILKAIGNLQRRKKEEPELVPEPEAAAEPVTPLDEDMPLPSWYREIYPAGERDGWFRKFGDYSCSFVERDRTQLVVSFDNLSQAGNEAYAREPWAQKFCEERGYSHLGVYAQTPTWFRDADLIDHLEQLRNDGFFKGFENVSFVGTSMGAFGALTFSSLAPGATVVAFSPQTTLDEAEVPWETRFAKGRAADWSLPYSDAATQTAGASKVYLVYDHFHAADRQHVDRLAGRNLVHLKGFGIGHKSALVLNRMDALKKVMEEGIAGTLDPLEFYKSIRARKDIYLYRTTVEGYLKERGQDDRLLRFANAFKKRRRHQNAA